MSSPKDLTSAAALDDNVVGRSGIPPARYPQCWQAAQTSLIDTPTTTSDSQCSTALTLVNRTPRLANVQDETVSHEKHTISPHAGSLEGKAQKFEPSDLAASTSSPISQASFFKNANNFVIEQFTHVENHWAELEGGHQEGSKRSVRLEDIERRPEEDAKRRVEVDTKRRSVEYEVSKKAEMADWEMRANEALRALEEKAMLAALLTSVDRGYIPRCNPDTRKILLARFFKWGRDAKATERLLWLFGPAGVGKSAVAQSVAEAMKVEDIFGAAFFFSRPNNRSDPHSVIPTLVYQLALFLLPYRLVLGQLFKENPQILRQERAPLFQQLITDCFFPDPHDLPSPRPLTLLSYLYQQLREFMTHHHLLIVLDGIDECKGRDAQREIVELIYACAHRDNDARFRWMLCSRPEPHLTVAFDSMENKKICRRIKLEVDDEEAQTDALRILEKGFAHIRARDPYQLGPTWPNEDEIQFIANRASGHLGFASFIIRFIGDVEYDDPARKLSLCLDALRKTSSIRDGANPFDALDFLYTQILSDIPKDILVTTKRILGVLILYGNEKLTAIVLANFIGLDRAAFYSSLQRLHSVLLIPFPEEAHQSPIKVYHASFSDYLSDQSRAGEFFLDEGTASLYVAGNGLEWLSHFSQEPPKSPPEPKWVSELWSPENIINEVCDYSFHRCWKAFPLTPKASLASLSKKLEDFDFNLQYSRWNSDDDIRTFAYFFQWLLSSDMKYLAKLDRRHSASGRPANRKEISITWDEKDPMSFVRHFIRNPKMADCFGLHVELQNRTKTAFHLVPSNYIRDSSQMREDDIIIAFMGESHSEASNLISVLTGKPIDRNQLPNKSRSIDFRATRTIHPRNGRNIVLVDTPSLSSNPAGLLKENDRMLRMFERWLANISAKASPKPNGIIYLQPLTLQSLSGFSRIFYPLCRYYKTVPLVLASTYGSASNDEGLPKREMLQLKEELRLRPSEPRAMIHLTHLTNQDLQAAWRLVDELICLVEANLLQELLVKKTTRAALSVIKKVKPLSDALESIKATFSQVENEDNPELKEQLIQEAQSQVKNITKEISGRTSIGKLIVRKLISSREPGAIYS